MTTPGGEEIELAVPPAHMRVGSGIMLLTGLLVAVLGVLLFASPAIRLPEGVYVAVVVIGVLTAADSIAVIRGDTWAVIAGLPLALCTSAAGAVIFMNGLCAGFVAAIMGLVVFVLLLASIGPSRRVARARAALRAQPADPTATAETPDQ